MSRNAYPLSWPEGPSLAVDLYMTPDEERAKNYAGVKKWRATHQKQKLEQQRRYAAKHPEKVRASSRRWRAKPGNRERRLKYMRDYGARNRERNKRAKLMHRYGLTVASYQALLGTQEGKCAICNESQPRTLHVDHCHETGEVRGLLCNGCNRVLGFALNNPARLRAAAAYLEKAKSCPEPVSL